MFIKLRRPTGRATKASLISSAALFTLVCCGDQPPDRPVGQAGSAAVSVEEFSKMVTYGVVRDYNPVGSVQELTAIADLVVLGRIESIGAGRSLGAGDAVPSTPTVIMKVRVIDTYKGTLPTDADVTYVEFDLPANASAAELDAAVPRDVDIALYLVPASDYIESDLNVVETFEAWPGQGQVYQTLAQGFYLDSPVGEPVPVWGELTGVHPADVRDVLPSN